MSDHYVVIHLKQILYYMSTVFWERKRGGTGWKMRGKEVWALVSISISNPSRVSLSLCDFT